MKPQAPDSTGAPLRDLKSGDPVGFRPVRQKVDVKRDPPWLPTPFPPRSYGDASSSAFDPLTQAFNRKYLDERLVAELAEANSARSDVVILLIDVDYLTHVNEHFGYLAGDRVLCSIAAGIQRILGAEGMLARLAGDEFVVVAARTGGAGAGELGERVRRAVEELQMSARGREVRVTVSVGVAALSELATGNDSAGALLALAAARMFAVKGSGRNRVCAFDSSEGMPTDRQRVMRASPPDAEVPTRRR